MTEKIEQFLFCMKSNKKNVGENGYGYLHSILRDNNNII